MKKMTISMHVPNSVLPFTFQIFSPLEDKGIDEYRYPRPGTYFDHSFFRVFPDLRFGSFYPKSLVLDSQKLEQESFVMHI